MRSLQLGGPRLRRPCAFVGLAGGPTRPAASNGYVRRADYRDETRDAQYAPASSSTRASPIGNRIGAPANPTVPARPCELATLHNRVMNTDGS